MIDHERDLRAVREATDRLLTAADALDNAAVAQASRLPGWTRGHVLAHLARNSDALVNVLEGRPMYVDAAQRDADIERDAHRSLADHLGDVTETSDRFLSYAAGNADWNRTVTLRNGVTDTAARLPFRRLIEVELHHVDLGIGYGLADLPASFRERETDFLAERFTGHPDVPPVTLAPVDGRARTTGGREGTPVTVSGTATALLGWLAGRGDGSELKTDGAPLPALPPL
ncbi:maleylpyruvate isomerase family mycothiol-dependent enzyme [Streptomyces tsukubensis]|uniref:Mycothiol maleylpyruvate isomerase n=1 Tax=Streptomyces tsukubensis TaxID=83656 RepID=A0A1V4A4I0_9ACTN|nr:maleylpyruvate isomerase family mycothiol-dependent enzyme [Streptomyces tsukubensis]OON74704.1 mycothiol maleylpyruvate isomerase [Streptomyces tsukubensis]QFR93025.1 maleylpyruvate isomerase family mycothiol-dependent enzyme [Streptomyces tsukubensis]